MEVPFLTADVDPGTVFYFGESVLLPSWRGQGIGVIFLKEGEDFACGLAGIRSVLMLVFSFLAIATLIFAGLFEAQYPRQVPM